MLSSLRIVLTGATGYLGSHLLIEGLRRGHRVVAIIRSKRSLDKLSLDQKKILDEYRERVCYVEHDLIRDRDLKRLTDRIFECLGGVDALINSAALWDDTDPFKISYERWIEILTLNLVAPYQLAVEMSNLMKSGVIINISCLSSLRGHRVYEPLKPSPAYVASKTALNVVTRYLADLLADKNIIVIGVAPSWIEKPEIERFREYLIKRLPLRRAARPEEVSSFIYRLIEEKNHYLSGSIIEIPGAL
ncbi:MAG: SDR family oxidoreductase [Sulfolobales archaeon]